MTRGIREGSGAGGDRGWARADRGSRTRAGGAKGAAVPEARVQKKARLRKARRLLIVPFKTKVFLL